MSKKNQENNQEEENAIKYLHTVLKPGDTVYTTLRHVSPSGMSRCIRLFVVHKGRILGIDRWVCDAIGSKFDKKYFGIKVGGCGMDMGFHLVYCLGRAMFPEGHKCSGDTCRSNDHFNDRNCKRDGTHLHRDAGYAFTQTWL